MNSTAQEIYPQIIQSLSPSERLRLATFILNGLLETNSPPIDQHDFWTEEDQTDIANFSLPYAASQVSFAIEDDRDYLIGSSASMTEWDSEADEQAYGDL